VAGIIYVAFLNGYRPPREDRLAQRLAESFPSRLEPLPVNFDLSTYYSPERGQYNATLILAHLLRHLPEADAKIIGLTNVDLFMPVLTFVFGQAQLNGPGAVVSTYRLRNEYYGLPPSMSLLYERTVKEIVHELGHTFGLVHCQDYSCVMHASTYVEEVDLKEARFCSECSAELGG
jgi:archaemetzincin